MEISNILFAIHSKTNDASILQMLVDAMTTSLSQRDFLIKKEIDDLTTKAKIVKDALKTHNLLTENNKSSPVLTPKQPVMNTDDMQYTVN